MKKTGLILFACFLLFSVPNMVSGNGEQPSSMMAVVPLAFYTPETGFAGGGAFVMISNIQPEYPEVKPNQVNVIAYYTQKHQYVLDANTEQYCRGNSLRVYASGNYKKFPDRFWGIGKHTTDDRGEDYTQVEFTVYGNPTWRIFEYFRIGPYYRFSHFKLIEIDPEGMLQDGSILGSESTRISGIGVETAWDSRDNIFYPLRGTLVKLRYVQYLKIIGSGEDFYQAELDCRQFLRSYREQVLAVQCKATVSNGNVPFQILPKLGGSTIMRGMYDGRFRDKHSLALQAEYRIPLFWRFGAVVFGSIGQVASRRDQFVWGDFRTAGGAGGRFSIMEGQRVNCRLDVGFCGEKMAIYFKYQEAF